MIQFHALFHGTTVYINRKYKYKSNDILTAYLNLQAEDLQDWHDFVRRTPDGSAAWIRRTSKECEILELRILDQLRYENEPIFVDTNISVETLREISDEKHVLIMLADPDISVNLFFNRPDREKQFLYRLMMEEKNPDQALENFRNCLRRINSPENYAAFLHSGFPVLLRDENRSIEETMALAESIFGLDSQND